MAITLLIEKLVHGGLGLARTAGGAIVFVPGVLPAEKVSIVPDGRRQGADMVRVIEVLEPSPDRRFPPCPFFGECGGCDWLYIEYPRQIILKKEIFLEAMRRIGKIALFPDPSVFASPEFGYRRRAQLKIDAEKRIGFFKRETNDVVAVTRCPLLTGRINSLLDQCRTTPEKLPGGVHSLRVVDGDAAMASHPHLPGITGATTVIGCGRMTFEVGGADFFQNNVHLLEPMNDWVASECSAGGTAAADLYGGIGFFSMMLARKFKTVWLVESDSGMAERAMHNARRNGVGNLRTVVAPAESMERTLPSRLDAMIVDPPRPGLSRGAREAVARMAPDLLIYVSCDCATQARDCGFFVGTAGYRIDAAALFDLYPNTHHTETIVVLRKIPVSPRG